MGKKTQDFTKKDADTMEAVDIVGMLTTPSTSDAKSTTDTKSVSDTKGVTDTRDEFRFSARFTPAQWKFLQEKKWYLSMKNHQTSSITAILQAYVEEDMKNHPEIVKFIDDLNG